MRRFALSISALGALAALAFSTVPAAAYGEVQVTSTISASVTVVPPGGTILVIVTIRDANGNPVAFVAVHFHDPGPRPGCDATFNPVDTTTDANGQAKTNVTLPPGCPGAYDVFAVTSSGIQLHLTLFESGGFPNTTANSPAPAAPSGIPAFGWALIAAGGALIATSGALVFRRRRAA